MPQSSAALAGMQIKNRSGEIVCRFSVGANPCGLELRAGATPIFSIRYQDRMGGKPSIEIGGKTVPLSPDPDGVSLIRLLIDGSIIEALVDGREMMTARCYTPSPAGIQLAWTGAPDALKSLAISSITPISADRLTA